MTISKREKILISIFLLAVVAVIYVNFFMVPQLNFINELKSIIEQDTAKLELNNAYKQKVDGMDIEIKILNQKLKALRAEFPAALNYDEIVMLLKSLSQLSGVNIQNISFHEPEIVGTSVESTIKQSDFTIAANIRDERLRQTLEDLGLNENEEDTEKNVKIPNGKAFKLTLDINARATDFGLKSFLDNLERLSIKTGISRISINSALDGSLTINFSLDFYGIRDNTVKDTTILGDFPWEPLESGHRDSIFIPFDELSGIPPTSSELAEIDTEELLNELSTYNFAMSVAPFGNNMAPPTVSLALKGMVFVSGSYSIPVIYGDNKNFETIEILVEESNGKYFTRFKTEHESFPDAKYEKSVEFIPKGDDIKMLIESTLRKFQDDTGGVVLNITNNTDKKFIVKIRNDDAKNSRIKLGNISNTVEVVY